MAPDGITDFGIALAKHCNQSWAPAEIFPRGGKVDLLLTLFRLLTMQRKWTHTKRFTLSTQQRKCPLLRQQLHTVFSL